MFTGIIQDVGTVVSVTPIENGGVHLSCVTMLKTSAWSLGDSVAINGCCLTLIDLDGSGGFSAQLSHETLEVTNLGALCVDDRVNIEPALRAADPLGGHIVSGHVDGVAVVQSINECGDFREVEFAIDRSLAPFVVVKGSVALDGVSLTVNSVTDHSFTVCLIPHTLHKTTLCRLQREAQVNLETDILGRFVARQLHFINAASTAYQGADDVGKL